MQVLSLGKQNGFTKTEGNHLRFACSQWACRHGLDFFFVSLNFLQPVTNRVNFLPHYVQKKRKKKSWFPNIWGIRIPFTPKDNFSFKYLGVMTWIHNLFSLCNNSQTCFPNKIVFAKQASLTPKPPYMCLGYVFNSLKYFYRIIWLPIKL